MFKSGQWLAICDSCGFKFHSSELRPRWDGLMVCKDDWEIDHPQKFIRVASDPKPLPWTRPRPTEVFVTTCTILTSQGIAGAGVAGCMVAGKNNHLNLHEYLEAGR